MSGLTIDHKQRARAARSIALRLEGKATSNDVLGAEIMEAFKPDFALPRPYRNPLESVLAADVFMEVNFLGAHFRFREDTRKNRWRCVIHPAGGGPMKGGSGHGYLGTAHTKPRALLAAAMRLYADGQEEKHYGHA